MLSISLALGVLFAIFTVAHSVIQSGRVALIMSTVAALTAVLAFALYSTLRRWALPPDWAHPVASGMAGIILFNTLLHLYLTLDPLQTTNVILLIMGVGFLLYSTFWWLVIVLASVMGWVLVVIQSPSDPAWVHFGFALLSASVISLVVHLARQRTLRRLEDLRLQDEQQQLKLSLALKSAEQIRHALETTIEVGQHIVSILDLDTLMNQVAELIKQRYGYYYVGIFLLDDSGERVVSRGGTGEAGRALCHQEFSLEVGQEGIIGWVAENRTVARVNDVARDERYVSVDAIPATRSELALPLVAGGEMLGVLDIQSDRIWAFNDDDVRVLESLAGQVSVAIQNALLYESERARRYFSEKLYDVGRALSSTLDLQHVLALVLRQLADIVPYDRGSVMLQQEDRDGNLTGDLVVVAAQGFPESANPLEIHVPIKENDVYQELRRTQHPLVVANVEEREDWQYVKNLPRARSWLGVPMILSDKVIGMLSLTRERPDPYTNEEMSLSAAFASQAAIALENARLYEDIYQINERLEATVNQLEERSRDLQVAYAQLERLDRAKSDFIGVASHELRTPLTVMSGYSQILSNAPEIRENEYYSQMIAGIQKGTQRLYDIVENMLDMAKIDSEALQLHPEPVFVGPMIRSIRQKLLDVLEERQLTLTLEELSDLPMVEADVEAVRKVFRHLMMNAVKYTPNGGEIVISGTALDDEPSGFPEGGIEVVVCDTGIGIDPSMHELIFTKFYHAGEISLHSTSGTKFKGGGPGLGLAIARGIVEAHGGKLWVESAGHDEETYPGSRFFVRLPISPLRESRGSAAGSTIAGGEDEQ